jgi:hypothetical protein
MLICGARRTIECPKWDKNTFFLLRISMAPPSCEKEKELYTQHLSSFSGIIILK